MSVLTDVPTVPDPSTDTEWPIHTVGIDPLSNIDYSIIRLFHSAQTLAVDPPSTASDVVCALGTCRSESGFLGSKENN